MKRRLFFLFLSILALTGCTSGKTPDSAGYVCITAQQAKEIIDTQDDYVILDAREVSEYEQGHIPGAIVISYEEIKEKAASALPDKNQLILVYCRSGRRSKLAAQDLADLGYTNVKEFGGIIDWPYEVVE